MAVINYSLQTVLGTAAELAALNPLLLEGQLGKEVDTNKFKLGDGVLNWNSIAYHTTNNTLSVFLGVSDQEQNLLAYSAEDGGLVLPQQALNTESVIEGVMDGSLSLSDRVAFALNEQHKLATLLLGVYVKRLAMALGGDYQNVLTAAGHTGDTVQAVLANLQSAITSLETTTSEMINDGVEANNKTWSSTKIASEILTAIQALRNQLVGDAGEALDTIYELANALSTNSNYITTLLEEVGKSIKHSVQSLTIEQKAQARVNIDAAEGALVGTYGEIADTSLLDHLGTEVDDGIVDPITLGQMADAVTSLQLKNLMSHCSMYKSNYHSETGQYLTVTWQRLDNSVAATSVMSNESAAASGLFTTRTETLFAADGTTAVRTTVYTLTYDAYRNAVSEVIQSVT